MPHGAAKEKVMNTRVLNEKKAAGMISAAAELNRLEAGTDRAFFAQRFVRAVSELDVESAARLYDMLTSDIYKARDEAIAKLEPLEAAVVSMTRTANHYENQARLERQAARIARANLKRRKTVS